MIEVMNPTNYTIPVFKLRCNRCNYEWIPRKDTLPERCAKCNSPYWNKPRTKGIKKEDKTQ